MARMTIQMEARRSRTEDGEMSQVLKQNLGFLHFPSAFTGALIPKNSAKSLPVRAAMCGGFAFAHAAAWG